MISSIPAKCPNCGADINFPPGQTSVVCEYCDGRILLSDVMKSEVGGGGAAVIGAEIEKKKLAIQMAKEDLRELQMQHTRLSSEVAAIQNPTRFGRSKGSGGVVVVQIMLFFLIFVVAINLPLFYMFGIYAVYGFTKDSCMITGILLIVGSILGIFGIYYASKSAEAAKRAQAMQSPDYQRKVWELQQLYPKVQKAEKDLEMLEQQLRAML